MQKTFLFISADGLTDPLGQSQILPYLIELSKKGFTTEIISIEKKQAFDVNSHIVTKLCSTHNIVWTFDYYDYSIPIISQILNFRRLKLITGKRIKKENTVLHCRSYLAALIGDFYFKKEKLPYIFDMRGFWADERIEGGIWNLKNPIHKFLYRFFKKKETLLIQNSSHIITLTEKAKKHLLAKHLNLFSEKISVIPCCADLNFFNPETINTDTLNELKHQLEITNDTFVITYNGSIGTWYMLEEMLLFFSVLSTFRKSVFLIFTKDNPEPIYTICDKLNINKNAVLVKPLKREEMPLYLKLSDASVFFIRPTFSKTGSSPTKMGELLSMGIPIVTNSGIGDVDDIIKNEKCGILISDFSIKKLNHTVEELINNMEIYRSNTKSTAKKYFNLDIGSEIYSTIYLKFTNFNV